MADYAYQEDGKLHTRYSTLLRCTPGQIDQVVAEMQGAGRFEGEAMTFGTVRHDMFEEEARTTGQLPACFGIRGVKADYIEHEFATEVLPGVIVHSRPDVVSSGVTTVYDYKTVVDGKKGWRSIVNGYRLESKQRQLKWYAFQLGLHGITIDRGAFLCEIWNAERDEILGYEVVEFPISYRDMAGVVAWAKDRIALLQVVMDELPVGAPA